MKIKLVLSVLLLGVIAFFIFKINSFSFSLMRSGYNQNNVQTIEHSFDSNKEEFKVIKTNSKNKEIVLAIITKNSMGIWNVTKTTESTSVNPNIASIAWINGGGAKRFLFTSDPTFEHEWHYVYYGTNAVKFIEFLPGQIPENVTVNIQQAGVQFWIHIISFAEPEVLNSISVENLLKENKCIPSE